jgi:hypothetical protein
MNPLDIELINPDTSRSLYDFYRIIVMFNYRTGVKVPDSKVAE